MTRRARQASESGWYHVTMRGAGRRALFEDDDDRVRFLRDLDDAARHSNEAVEIPAWCLMDNHVHLVVKAEDLSSLQRSTHRLCSGYASRFNRKNGHVGPVFQERFASFPIESDAYLMEAIRYVHLNCRDKGFEDPARYRWSSYRLFIDGPRTLAMDGIVDLFGGPDGFKRFHAEDVHLGMVEAPTHRRRLDDERARRIARIECGSGFAEVIPLMEHSERDRAIARLYALGLSTRQLERMTGIGRSVIRRVCHLK